MLRVPEPDPRDARIAELEALVASLLARLARLEAENAELRARLGLTSQMGQSIAAYQATPAAVMPP